MMVFHKRYFVVKEAQAAIDRAVLDACVEHDLTPGEIMSILGDVLKGHAKYIIRRERHPDDPSTPGDCA